MKAIVYTEYGPPEVARLKDVPKPVPKENEVLVKVYASTVNRTDSGFRSAEYFISRFWSGLLRPKFQVLGSEFAGVVDEIGQQVTTFKRGDRVFGFNDKSFGGHAEYSLSCRWSEYFVIVGLPTNNLVVAEGQDISGLEAEFYEH